MATLLAVAICNSLYERETVMVSRFFMQTIQHRRKNAVTQASNGSWSPLA